MRLVRRALVVLVLVAFCALGALAWLTPRPTEGPRPPAPPPLAGAAPARPAPVPSMLTAAAATAPVDCSTPAGDSVEAADNTGTSTTLAVSPYGVGETGWAVYGPLIAQAVGAVGCDLSTPRFAAQVLSWQKTHGLPATGRVDAATLNALAVIWLERRPFVLAAQKGCPPAPDEATLATALAVESYGGKTVKARPAALEAYRRMAAAARQAMAPQTPALRIGSAYRGPVEEALRCAIGGCGTAGKARCSAHRTGLAFDFDLDPSEGPEAFSTDAANRLRLSRTPTYLWLVANAARFGFVNYPYEPWHWEWTGEPV